MHENLDASLDFILEDEGGWVQKPNGACGNMGVGMATLIEWRKLHGQPRPTINDLKNLSPADAKAIYTELYAQRVLFDGLPSGLDYCALDAAVNEGVGGAMRLLAATAGMPVKDQIVAICDKRLAAKKMRADWDDHILGGLIVKGHGLGWTRRIGKMVPARALAMIEPAP
jgi:lysozyme family protein